jgi:hypothetical protein
MGKAISSGSANGPNALTDNAGRVFALCAPNSAIDVTANAAPGIYFHDTRYLDRATLPVNGQPVSVALANAGRPRPVDLWAHQADCRSKVNVRICALERRVLT